MQLDYKDNLLETIVDDLHDSYSKKFVENFVGWPWLEKSHCKQILMPVLRLNRSPTQHQLIFFFHKKGR